MPIKLSNSFQRARKRERERERESRCRCCLGSNVDQFQVSATTINYWRRCASVRETEVGELGHEIFAEKCFKGWKVMNKAKNLYTDYAVKFCTHFLALKSQGELLKNRIYPLKCKYELILCRHISAFFHLHPILILPECFLYTKLYSYLNTSVFC